VTGRLRRGPIWSAVFTAVALASLFRWRHEVEHAALSVASFMWQWTWRAVMTDDWFVALLLAGVATALVQGIGWIVVQLTSPGLGCAFEELSREQQDFLKAQFSRGTRRIDVEPGISFQKWFTSLVKLEYLVPEDVRVAARPTWRYGSSENWPYDVTDAGWRELKRKLPRRRPPPRRR
jgi:hypothetical protein